MSKQVNGGSGGEARTYAGKMTYVEFLDKSPMTPFHWLLVIGVSLAQFLDGIDYMALAYALPMVIKDFRLNPTQAGLLGTATNFGLLLGSLFFSLLSGRFGRRPVFLSVVLTYAIGTGLCAIAPSYEWLLVFRFIAGIGIGAEFPVVVAYLAEYAPVKHRHWIIPTSTIMYPVGWIAASFLAVWLVPKHGWRIIFWIGVSPALMVLFIYQFMPESVRYLLVRGKTEEAGRIVRRLADKYGMSDTELVPPLSAPGKKSGDEVGLRGQLSALRRSFGPLMAMSAICFMYFVQSYGLGVWLPTLFVKQGFTLLKSFWFSTFTVIAQPFAITLATWQQQRFQRKVALLMQIFIGSAFFILFGLSFELRMPGEVTVAARFLSILLGAGFAPILLTMCAEVFPTNCRSLGTGIVLGFGRVGAMAGPFAIGLFLSLGSQIHDIVYGLCAPMLLLSIAVILVIKGDPRGKTLEETIKK